MRILKYALALSLRDKSRFVLVLTSNTLAFIIIFSTFFFIQTMISLGSNIVNDSGGDYWVLPKGYASYITSPPIDINDVSPLLDNKMIASLYAIQEVQLPAHLQDNSLDSIEVRVQNVLPLKLTSEILNVKSDSPQNRGVLSLTSNQIIINSIAKTYLKSKVGDKLILQDRTYSIAKIITDSSEQPRAYIHINDLTEAVKNKQAGTLFAVININPAYQDTVSTKYLNSILPKSSKIQIVPRQLVNYVMINNVLPVTSDKTILLLLIMAIAISLGTTIITMFTNTLNLKQHYYHLHEIGVSQKNIFLFIWAQGSVYLLPAVILSTVVATLLSGVIFRQTITPIHSWLPNIKLYTVILIALTTLVSVLVSILGAVIPYYFLIKKNSFLVTKAKRSK